MQNLTTGSSLLHEEKNALKWFVMLFYGLFISFDVFYFYIYPEYILHENIDFLGSYRYVYYLLVLSLIPAILIIFKKTNLSMIKYFFFISYILLTILYDSVSYFGSGQEYKSGNVVEVFLILFAPIFVNSNFFWTVSLGIIFKYSFIGLFLQSNEVLFPIALILFLSLLGWITLKRFQGYIEAIKTSYDDQLSGIVKGVIATIELKDPYTRGHSERVAFYANSLAQATGKYSFDELRTFRYACLLHDIGKVNIPDSILMKPGKLTMEEYEVIKKHPEVGANAIAKVKNLEISLDVIRYHHERWDGGGYPERLEKEEIPYLARIVSIADAFDAMTSSRSYRSAMPVEEAFKRIVEGKGTQFDPELVEKFKNDFPQWVKFHREYNWLDNLPLPAKITRKEVKS